MGSGILGLPTFASPVDIERIAFLWWAPSDLQHPWHVVTRRSRPLSRRLNYHRTDRFENRNFPMRLLSFSIDY